MGRIERESNERRENPGPGTQRIMRDVEPQRSAERIFFVLGRENSLRDITAAAGLRARIPTAPPLDAQEENEGDERNCPESFTGEAVRKVWKEIERIGDSTAGFCGFGADDAEAQRERADTTDFGDGDPGENDDHSHFQDELEKIGDEHAPEATDECVNSSEGNQDEDADEQRSVMRLAERVTE